MRPTRTRRSGARSSSSRPTRPALGWLASQDVCVYNPVAQNTREGSVLQRVLSRLDIMREQVGDGRVYDVIDEWLEGVPLVALMEKAIAADAPRSTW